MCIERIDNIIPCGIFRSHLRKIRRAAAADYKDINVLRAVFKAVRTFYRDSLRANREGRRVSSRVNCAKLHVLIFIDCCLNAAPKISVTKNTNFHNKSLLS